MAHVKANIVRDNSAYLLDVYVHFAEQARSIQKSMMLISCAILSLNFIYYV